MSTVQTKETVIALLGQPNSGKSTLFNGLTVCGSMWATGPARRWNRRRGISPVAA